MGKQDKDFFFLRFYLFIHSERAKREAETQAEGEAGSRRKPDVGLDPESPGSYPGLQAALNWGCPRTKILRWDTGDTGLACSRKS